MFWRGGPTAPLVNWKVTRPCVSRSTFFLRNTQPALLFGYAGGAKMWTRIFVAALAGVPIAAMAIAASRPAVVAIILAFRLCIVPSPFVSLFD